MKKHFCSIENFKNWADSKSGDPGNLYSDILDRICELDKKVKAFGHLDSADILKDKAKDSAKKGFLTDVPIGIKDNICIKGRKTTCASRILEGFRPPYNAHVIDKLLDEGTFLINGANMDEFAFGSSCETSVYGPTKNPWDFDRIPGGSSGGAVAAVASSEVIAALGSDTGGSIRQPAAMCGVVGFKPTYGRVSRFGLIAFASSLDQIGPITRNVSDCARMLEVISGYDNKDSTSVNIDVPNYTESLFSEIKGMRIGVPAEYMLPEIDPGVKKRINEAIDVFKDLGAEIVEISLPHTKYAVSCYYIIAPAEASSNLARYDGVHYGHRSEQAKDLIEMYIKSRNEGFGKEAKRRILLGTYALSSGYYEAYYLKAQKVRTKISRDFKEAFKLCDCILTPTSPSTAFKIGDRIDDPIQMYLSDIFTIPANLAGLPAVSIPCGLVDNLPVGMQLMAAPFKEEDLIKCAHAFESNTEHHKICASDVNSSLETAD